jgi:hypothetical protein
MPSGSSRRVEHRAVVEIWPALAAHGQPEGAALQLDECDRARRGLLAPVVQREGERCDVGHGADAPREAIAPDGLEQVNPGDERVGHNRASAVMVLTFDAELRRPPPTPLALRAILFKPERVGDRRHVRQQRLAKLLGIAVKVRGHLISELLRDDWN